MQKVELRNGKQFAGRARRPTPTAGIAGIRTLKDNFSLAPLLSESHGLTNRQAPRCDFTVYVDKPPAVKVLTPDDQMAVRPDDSVDISFAAQDDVGIGSAELVVYGTDEATGETKPLATIPIPLDDQQGERSVQGKVQLDLSKFKVIDGSELSYEIRVREDRGPAESEADRIASTGVPQSNPGNQSNPSTPTAAPTEKMPSPSRSVRCKVGSEPVQRS